MQTYYCKSVKRIKLKCKDATGCAFYIETKNGEEYTLVNTPKGIIGDIGNWKCSADLTIFAKKGKRSIVYVGNGSFVETRDIKIEADKTGCFYVEYDQNSFFVRSQCPIKLIPKNGKCKILKEVLHLKEGEALFK